ncbi:MAG: response regulator [Planctomycetota bacterium]|jgi:CheY-like chemotaxis protein
MGHEKIKCESSMILLVEDNQDHADLIMRNLKGHQVANRVCHICDGEAALDYLFQRNEYADPMKSPRPGVVLLDLRLPKIDGLEVLKEIKASEGLRKIPVVILTTSEAERDIARAYDYHANSYLVKPVNFEEFTKLMSNLCYYWLGWNHCAML